MSNAQSQPDQPLWPYIARNLDVRWLDAVACTEPVIVLGDLAQPSYGAACQQAGATSGRPYYRLTVSILPRLIRAIESLHKRGRSNGDTVAIDEATKGAAALSPLLDWMSQHSGEPESAWAAAWETGGSIPDDGRLLWELASIDKAVGAEAASRAAFDRWVEAGGICTADADDGKTPSESKQHRLGRGRQRGKRRVGGSTTKAGAGLW